LPIEPKNFPFEAETLEKRGYLVFPDELENNELVFFHATPANRVESILKDGLKPGKEVGGNLSTISYSPKSVIALTHWIQVRSRDSDGVVLALKFDALDEIFVEGALTILRHSKSSRSSSEFVKSPVPMSTVDPFTWPLVAQSGRRAVQVVGESIAQLTADQSRDITEITFPDWPTFDVQAPAPPSQ
jgi:hypothetical protein